MIATARMVRRGSTVRVRQRALRKRRTRRFFVQTDLHRLERAAGMAPLIEPSGSERALEALGNGRIRLPGLPRSIGWGGMRDDRVDDGLPVGSLDTVTGSFER